MNVRCLNCGSPLRGKYCVDCGQRASTRRFSAATLRDAEFWEQNFSFTRGLPRTLLHLLYRPGHLMVDYLAGKRRQYFPFLGLLLLLITADVVLRGYLDLSPAQMLDARYGIGLRGIDTSALHNLLIGYFRVVQLAIIPVVALILYLIFRTASGYNFWEFVVLSCLLVSAQIWVAMPAVVVANVLPSPAAQGVCLAVGKVLAYGITGLAIAQLVAAFYAGPWWRSWRGPLALLMIYLMTKIVLLFGIFAIRYWETGDWNAIVGDSFMIDF